MVDKITVSRHVTSFDVARSLGVSQSMVSRAFSPGGRISKQNRERVLAAAAKLGYFPNAVARSLSTRRSGIIALIAGEPQNPFYAVLLDALSGALAARDLRSLLFNAPAGEDVAAQLPALAQHHVDGLIVISARVSSAIAADWQRDGRPIVLINRTTPNSVAMNISCDNAAGARAVADLMIGRGLRRLCYVAGPHDTSTNRARQAAFLGRLMERGLPLVGGVEAPEYSFEAGRKAAPAAMACRPDAIFFASDVLALGGMDGLRCDLGLSIPEDISVAGFDDIPMASWPSYRLTTIRQPVAEMAARAVAIMLGEEQVPGEILLPGTLIVRDSLRKD